MRNKSGKGIEIRSGMNGFYFLRPAHNSDLMDIAKRIMGVSDVAEVYITEGRYGLLVKTDPMRAGGRRASSYIRRNFKEKHLSLLSHFCCRKA